MKEAFLSGDIYGGFVIFAKLILQGNKLKMAKKYAKTHNLTGPEGAQQAMKAVAPLFAPYENLSDEELVAISVYAGLDQGSYIGPGATEGGYAYQALNGTLTNGTADDRLALAPFATVLHQGLEQLVPTTQETWDRLNNTTGGTYGQYDAVDDPQLGPVPMMTRGINLSADDLAKLGQMNAGDAWGGDHRFNSSTGGEQLAKPFQGSNVVIHIQSDHAAVISPIAESGQFLQEVIVSPGYTLVLAKDPVYDEETGKWIVTLTTAPIETVGGTAGVPLPTPQQEKNAVSLLLDFAFSVADQFDDALDLLPTESGVLVAGTTAGTLLNNFYGAAQADPAFDAAFRDYVQNLTPEEQQELLLVASTGPNPASPEAIQYLQNIVDGEPSASGRSRNGVGEGDDSGGRELPFVPYPSQGSGYYVPEPIA
jgi:hypothetical protein